MKPISSPIEEPTRSPAIAPCPRTGPKRLIDSGFLQYEASLAGRAERYGRGETSHTIHVWWARRPHSAMRALVYASLCKTSTAEQQHLLAELTSSANGGEDALERARTRLQRDYGASPRVLDMFGGGGTIPYEASLLGADAYSIDSNELSVFIQKCNLEYRTTAECSELGELLEASGRRVLERLRLATEALFPLRASNEDTFAYLWTYSKRCKGCGFEFLLSKRPWLSKKKGKRVGFRKISRGNREHLEIDEDLPEGFKLESNWVGRGSVVRCPKCASESTRPSVADCKDTLAAIGTLAKPSGKAFAAPPKSALPAKKRLVELETSLLKQLGATLPASKLPKWSGIVNPALYGIDTHADFLNLRQRVVVLQLISLLRDESQSLSKNFDESTVAYVVGMLSSLIDQLVDWNCRLSTWISQNEQVGRAFCGPGISMYWDYVEIDPLSKGPANLWKKLERIVRGAQNIGTNPKPVAVQQALAQQLPFEDDFFDAIVTDPPYYDNIFYTILADFFFSWKRLLLKDVAPELFRAEHTDFSRELVASKHRHGDQEGAHTSYSQQMQLAIGEASRVLKPDGVFSFVYSHSAIKGWLAIVDAYRHSDFRITSVQPLSIERKQRPRAMTSQAVNTCVAIVARKTSTPKKAARLGALLESVSELFLGEYSQSLEQSGWSPDDVGVAIFANGACMLANATGLRTGESTEEALIAIGELVAASVEGFRISNRASI